MGDRVDSQMTLGAYRDAMTPKTATTGTVDYLQQLRDAFPTPPAGASCPCCNPARCPHCGRPYGQSQWPPALPWWPVPQPPYRYDVTCQALN